MVYVAASMDRLAYGPPAALELLERLVDHVATGGTLVMPSFPFRNDIGRMPEGSRFDVRTSPSGMGLLSELFRRRDGTRRSEHYWLPFCATGVDADVLLADQRAIVDPFSPDATLGRIVEASGTLVGLGVSLNYNFVVHLADRVLGHRYPCRILAEQPMSGEVRGWDDQVRPARSLFIEQHWRKAFRPSALIDVSPVLQQAMRASEYQGARAWALPAVDMLREALRVGECALDRGQLPPWLTVPACKAVPA